MILRAVFRLSKERLHDAINNTPSLRDIRFLLDVSDSGHVSIDHAHVDADYAGVSGEAHHVMRIIGALADEGDASLLKVDCL